MTTLQLSKREQQLLTRLRTRQRPTIAHLITGVYTEELASGQMTALKARRAMTSLIRALNAKLAAAKKGRVVRVSPRGRGNAGIYQLKKR